MTWLQKKKEEFKKPPILQLNSAIVTYAVGKNLVGGGGGEESSH